MKKTFQEKLYEEIVQRFGPDEEFDEKLEKRLRKRSQQKLNDDEMGIKDFEVVAAPAKTEAGSNPGHQVPENPTPVPDGVDEVRDYQPEPGQEIFPPKFENAATEKPEAAKPETEEVDSDERPDFEMIGFQSDKSDQTDPDMVKVSNDNIGGDSRTSSSSSHSSHEIVEHEASGLVFPKPVGTVFKPEWKPVGTGSSSSSSDSDEKSIGFSKFEKIRRKFQAGPSGLRNQKTDQTGQTGSETGIEDPAEGLLPDNRDITEEVPVAFEVFPPKHSEVSIEVGTTTDDAEAEGSKPISVELVPPMNRLRSSFHNMVIIPIKENE